MISPLRRALVLSAAVAAFGVAAAGSPADAAEQYVLAVNWQPAFCETRPETPECETQTDDRFDASHFALHGLWPQPRDNVYCDVPLEARTADRVGHWGRLPVLDLADETRTELERVMPGSRSFLHRHEWVKHGSCYSPEPQAYYADSLRLMAELNASPVRTLFADSVGSPLAARDIRSSFDEAFGKGAGERVHVACRRVGARRLIVELTVNLAGPITPERDLGTLLREAPLNFHGCRAGIVDRVGIGLTDDPS